MNNISIWILSIVGIVIITMLADIILPNGKTNKLIKSVFAIFSVFIFLLPLKKLDLSNLDISSLINNFSIDKTFVENRNKEKIKELECVIEKSLADNGYCNIDIEIQYEIVSEKANIKGIYVNLCSSVLKAENLNINKYTNIMAIIKKFVTIKEECIIFYE